MRALSKIIFVNSAHIRYAEIRLDGNVHFIGTQGVGKSTLLRAILFFYNAEKLHLGIPREMKPFDEFYLPYANSYIVYEVEHEHGAFSILVNRSSYGRASYRFIDSPFRKEWLVDDLGEVTAEQTTINARLGKTPWQRVEDYSQYRDIIYGNHKNSDKKFSRYQLIETQNYKNIYRSIQNVFLNSRLDADFIKEIIIRSMNETEASINLGYYRNQVADFEQEYKDISCWYKTNQKGEIPVRLQADKVIATYHNLLYLKAQIANLCGELNYAVRVSEERLPLIGQKMEKLAGERDRQLRLLGETQQKYKNEEAALERQTGVVNHTLESIKKKRAYYGQLQIESVIRRCGQEEMWKRQLDASRQRLQALTAQYDDITLKYKRLEAEEKSRFEAFRQMQLQQELQLAAQAVEEKEALASLRDKKRLEIESWFAEKLAADADLVDSVKKEQEECGKSLYALNYFNPYASHIEDLRRQLQECNARRLTLKSEIDTLTAEINLLVSEFEHQEATLLARHERSRHSKAEEISAVEDKMAEIDSLLARTKGSLYEWLAANMPGWEQTIGKVADEQRVLYQTGLRPLKSQSDGQTLFGVSLDLSGLPLSVRKPDELKAQKAFLQHDLMALKNECILMERQKDSDIEQLKRQYSPKLKALREKRGALNVELDVLPNKTKALEVQIHDFEAQTQTEKEARLSELASRQQDIAHRLDEARAKQQKTSADRQRQLKAADKAYADAKADVGHRLQLERERIKADIRQQEKASEAYLLRLRQQELDELKGKGADTSAAENCKRQIDEILAELSFIRDNLPHVFNYRRDKEELFDREPEFKDQKRQLGDKLRLLAEKYAARRQEHERRIAGFSKEINGLKEEENKLKDGLQSASRFVADDNLCPPKIHDCPECKTLNSPQAVVNELTSAIVGRQNLQNQFKQCINVFKDNFSAKNTFRFRTVLNTDDDYLDFASNLDDFMQNNKIEDYRSRVNERYIEILRRVSKEMGDLTRYESEVDKIIREINSDFRERNFVGVIKLIALQMKHSSDQIVQLMKRIKDFHDENRDDMGEVTLFSTEKRNDVNRKAVEYILEFMKSLNDNPTRQALTLSDLFQLEFRVVENDNDTGWVAKISHVGSEGTDTLVKAMVNIMLINVFKEKVSKKFGDFQIHCMMDEIGKLHPKNVKGILEFANSRNILLVNSSPITHNVSDYRYTYLLDKDGKSNTVVHPLISQK